ncbi:MAG: hypothetical protein WD115_05535 [Balneolaceae bacterium]
MMDEVTGPDFDGSDADLTKRRRLAWLLLLCCLASAVTLMWWEPDHSEYLRSGVEADSLIRHTIDHFGVMPNNIRVQTIRIDSLLERKHWSLDIPSGFSATDWHYQLHRNLHPYGVESPARIFFPEREMLIHLIRNETTFRTIRLIPSDTPPEPDNEHQPDLPLP